MAELFNRDISLNVGGIGIFSRGPDGSTQATQTLRVSFSVEKGTNKQPNRAAVMIWNLNADNRGLLQQQADGVPVSLDAGYADNSGELFTGNLSVVSSQRQGVDWVTTVESGDGETAFRSARSSISLKAGAADLQTILTTAAEDMGVGVGNALTEIKKGNFRKGLTEFVNGFTGSGPTPAVLDKVATASGYEWFIQDGQIIFLKPGQTLNIPIFPMDKGSGLVGAPELGEKGIVRAKSLLRSEIKPGRAVRIDSQTVNGDFRVEKVIYEGDTGGDAWYTNFEGSPIS